VGERCPLARARDDLDLVPAGSAADQIEELRAFGDEEKLLVAPEPLLTSPIVLTSWRNQLTLDSYDDQTVKQFIRFFKNNQDFAPEAGASCSGQNSTTRP
jgi:hypothetical protein